MEFYKKNTVLKSSLLKIDLFINKINFFVCAKATVKLTRNYIIAASLVNLTQK